MTKAQAREMSLQGIIDQQCETIRVLEEKDKQHVKDQQELQGKLVISERRCEMLEFKLACQQDIIDRQDRFLGATKAPQVNISILDKNAACRVSDSDYERLHKEQQVAPEQEDEIFHFIHPSVECKDEWCIHNEVKRLVTRNGLQEICQYLLQMKKDNKILLPQSPSVAYHELVRMGMPDKEGCNENTFRKYYNCR